MQLTRSQLNAIFEAQDLRFLGLGPLRTPTRYQAYEAWLRAGKHAEMAYMERHQDLRRAPEKLLDGAQTILSFAYAYGPVLRPKSTKARVAAYALGPDYHKILWKKGDAVCHTLGQLCHQSGPIQFRTLVDSAPILERSFASQSAQGFIGKHTGFIHYKAGSFVLLGEILCSLALELIEDQELPGAKECGTCKRCQIHCPTGALDKDYSLDARLCLSYWTIEHRGLIPKAFWPHLGRYWYGCDICQDVCPQNRLPRSSGPKMIATDYDLYEVATMDQSTYVRLFGGTAMTRAKIGGLRRNALIALYVQQDSRLAKALEVALLSQDPILEKTALEIKKSQQSQDFFAGSAVERT